jgi:hypothetical protein
MENNSSTHICPLTGNVVNTGQSMELGSPVLKYDGWDAEKLGVQCRKQVTAKVDGEYIGWSGINGFLNYKFRREHDQEISEITFWADRPHQEFCRYHVCLLIACGYDKKQFYIYEGNCKDWTEEQFDTLYKRNWGHPLPQGKKAKVKFQTRFDKKGYRI